MNFHTSTSDGGLWWKYVTLKTTSEKTRKPRSKNEDGRPRKPPEVMEMKTNRWSAQELAAVRANLEDWSAEGMARLISAVQGVNPHRAPKAIRDKALILFKTERKITAELSDRIAAKWRAGASWYGRDVEPSIVCALVNNLQKVGFEPFVGESARLGFLPPGACWKALVPVRKHCRGCNQVKDGTFFRFDPASSDGLGSRCRECVKGAVMRWRVRKRVRK